jgi:hypothetical protein
MKPSRLYPWRLRAALALIGTVLAIFASISANAQNIQWFSADVGTPTLPGSATVNGNGTITIVGGGDDIWNASDNCHYYYAWGSGQTWDAIVEVTAFDGPDFWSKCELMVRASDPAVGPRGPDSFLAMMATQNWIHNDGVTAAENAVIDQFRTASGGSADWKQAGNNPVPVYPGTWMGIHRNGSVFTIYYYLGATDPGKNFAVNWTKYIDIDTAGKNPPITGQDNATTWNWNPGYPDIVAVGVAVTAHNNTDTVGAIATIANLSATFPATQPPTAVGVTQPIQGVATNVLGGEASLSFVATNNAVPSTIATAYQWYKNGVAITGATNSFHTWLLDAGDDTAQFYCKAGCPPPYTSVPQVQSGTVTAKVLAGTKYSNGFRIEKFTSTGVSRTAVEQGNVPPATLIDIVPNTDSPGGLGNDYVTRVSGWFVAPTSDNYVFFLAADDDTDLFLSTDDKIANKKFIAQETAWSNMDNWLTSPGGSSVTQKRSDGFVDPVLGTAPGLIPLVAGHSYYFEEVHHQGGGGDCFTVTYQTATMMSSPTWATDFNDGTNSLIYAASNCMSYATIPATTLTWVSQPTNTQATAGFPAKFYARAVSDSEFSVKYQWYRGVPPTGALIAGATAANFASANTTAADDGATFYCVATTAENEFTLTSVTASVQVGLPVIEKGWALDEYWYTLNPGIGVFRTTKVVNGVNTVFLGSYANGPDHTIVQPRLEGNSHGDAGSDFTEKVSAIFYPPTTTEYVFFTCSDDDSDLYVSTDQYASNAVLVAQETGWSGSWQWLGVGGGSSVQNKCSATWTDGNGNTPWATGIHMNANQPYYVAIVHHEGGGGDNVEATFMTMAEFNASGATGPANGQYSRFTGNLIATYVPRAFSAEFTQQPGTVSAPLGGLATLTAVGVTDSLTPIGDNYDPRPEWNNFMVYQWLRDGVPIAGANKSTYAFGPVSPADSAIQFVCTCRAMGYTDNSSNPLWKTSSVANIVVTGNPVYETGFGVHEYWNSNPGRVTIENNAAGDPSWIMAVPGFAVNDAAVNFADNYSDELVGFFIPPSSGNYVFYINSDDDADLFLGTGPSASSRRLIAQETAWASGVLQWGASAGNAAQVRSDTFVDPATGLVPYASGIPLTGGQKYFLQAVHHEGGGGDYNCVTYTKFGDPTPANGTVSAIRGAALGTYVPKCSFVNVTTQPQSLAVENYVSSTFTAGAATDSIVPVGGEGDWRPFFNNFIQFQWYKNGTAVAGATTSAYTIPQVLPTDNNAQIYCAMRALGYGDNVGNPIWTNSQIATLTVNVTAPQLTYAAYYLNTNTVVFGQLAVNYITIAFSNPMDPVGLSNPGSYTLPAGVTLLSITVNSNDYRSVALAVSGPVTLPVNISVSPTLTGLGGGLALTGGTTVAVKSVPLTNGDIGPVPGQDPAWPGMMYVMGTNAYTIACEGSDIWDIADGFNFAWERKTGDFDVVVRQKTIKHTSNWAKGGLMVREDLTAGSRNWNIINDPLASDGIQAPDGSGPGASQIECNVRYTNDQATAGWVGEIPRGTAPAYPNAWVRIARKGSVLTAYSSTDGKSWTARATNDTAVVGTGVPLPSTVYIGLCTTAHNNDPVGSTFDQLRFLNVVDYDNYNSSYVYVPVTVGPTITATKSGSNINISWTPAGGTLLGSPALGAGANWQPIGTANPASVPITGAAQFFRVQE